MRMALVAAGRAHGAWSTPCVLSNRCDLLSSSHNIAATATVQFGARRVGGSIVILCLASGGGHPWDSGEWEPAGSPWDGQMVDEGMATLRQRIREVEYGKDDDEKEPEEEDESGVNVFVPPGEWTELEQRHHGLYVTGVREALGILFALLVRMRPGLGAEVVALVLLSVPASVLLVSVELVRAVHSISAAVASDVKRRCPRLAPPSSSSIDVILVRPPPSDATTYWILPPPHTGSCRRRTLDPAASRRFKRGSPILDPVAPRCRVIPVSSPI